MGGFGKAMQYARGWATQISLCSSLFCRIREASTIDDANRLSDV